MKTKKRPVGFPLFFTLNSNDDKDAGCFNELSQQFLNEDSSNSSHRIKTLVCVDYRVHVLDEAD